MGGLKCTGTPATYVVTDEDDSKTARLVIFADESLSTSASTENIVYLAGDADQKASSDTYTTDDLWLMEDLTNPAGIIITDDNTDQGFYTYSMDGDNYKLEDANDLQLNAAYDDEDGYMNGLAVESVYNKSGKAYVTFVDSNNYLDDVKFNGVTVIDTRSESDIDNSAYPTEIISIADLKDAVETTGSVVADVYFDDGVTFLAVTSVDGVRTDDVTDVDAGDVPATTAGIAALDNGVYRFADKPATDANDYTCPATDVRYFVFDAVEDGDVTLVIDNTSTYTETKSVSAGDNFFYVQVINSASNDMLNVGTGTMKSTPLSAGDHTYTITDDNGTVLMAGTFTI